ncbi:MAG: DUF2911 domain-containing protein [Bacteroidota bacterium]
MKKRFVLLPFILIVLNSTAQVTPMITPPNGGNKKAWVGERIGITDVSIRYDRPGVKGREGNIYGTPVVHRGFQDLTYIYGNSKAAPWRAGANENTTIEFSTPVKIEGKDLPAGKYGFFVAYDPGESILIFSRNTSSWGSFFYRESEDVLRVKVTPVALEKSVEWLKYEFINQTENTATLALQWEKLMIPFKIEVDYLQTQLDLFRSDLRGDHGFNPGAWQQAAQFCLDNTINLEEGLQWADSASSAITWIGNRNFQTLSLKAALLEKLGRKKEAMTVMKEAVPLAGMMELHIYARQLLKDKKVTEALEAFKINASKNRGQFLPLAGLTRGYSATGDLKNALRTAKQALPLAPNEQNKKIVEDMIGKLEQGKDINQ